MLAGETLGAEEELYCTGPPAKPSSRCRKARPAASKWLQSKDPVSPSPHSTSPVRLQKPATSDPAQTPVSPRKSGCGTRERVASGTHPEAQKGSVAREGSVMALFAQRHTAATETALAALPQPPCMERLARIFVVINRLDSWFRTHHIEARLPVFTLLSLLSNSLPLFIHFCRPARELSFRIRS